MDLRTRRAFQAYIGVMKSIVECKEHISKLVLIREEYRQLLQNRLLSKHERETTRMALFDIGKALQKLERVLRDREEEHELVMEVFGSALGDNA
jgi:hypothetical protein